MSAERSGWVGLSIDMEPLMAEGIIPGTASAIITRDSWFRVGDLQTLEGNDALVL